MLNPFQTGPGVSEVLADRPGGASFGWVQISSLGRGAEPHAYPRLATIRIPTYVDIQYCVRSSPAVC